MTDKLTSSHSDRLDGRRILVVGAGTRPSDDPDAPHGNGRAISILAARDGARVACADISTEAAEHTTSLIGDEGGIFLLSYQASYITGQELVVDGGLSTLV